MAKSNMAENMVSAGIDQDWAEKVDAYNKLSKAERAELASWLMTENIRSAPAWVSAWIVSLASTAFLETGLRWAKRNDDSPST